MRTAHGPVWVHRLTVHLPAPARVAVVAIAGAVLVLAGAVMLVLPGPGVVTIVAGLAVWSAEFSWARRILQRVTAIAHRAWDRVRRMPSRLR